MTATGPGPALRTGAGSEIGRAIAEDLAGEGRHVVLCGRSGPSSGPGRRRFAIVVHAAGTLVWADAARAARTVFGHDASYVAATAWPAWRAPCSRTSATAASRPDTVPSGPMTAVAEHATSRRLG
jgi:NAD(P)-dependent dehydrogenase (short-subunit alcohol dehydrogenase family)